MNKRGLLNSLCVLTETYKHARAAGKEFANLGALKKSWAEEMLKLLGVELTTLGQPQHSLPTVFIGNHVGYIDAILLMATIPDITFVATQEIESWPIFGEAARKAGTVFVDRSSTVSRMQVRATIRDAMLAKPRSVAIFPAGKTTLKEDHPWKRGAFRIAEETNTPLQAFRISYTPLRTAAFIGKDYFLPNLIHACSSGAIQARIEFAEPVLVADPEAQCVRWQLWCREAGGLALPEKSPSLVQVGEADEFLWA